MRSEGPLRTIHGRHLQLSSMNSKSRPTSSLVDEYGAARNVDVSVIVPTYNCEPYIEQTLRSVLAQSVSPLEVIVVDDGSTDSTVARAEAMGERVRVHRQTNRGVSHARNLGFELSRGSYVCFLDHDDYWFPWKLELQTGVMAADPGIAVAYTPFREWHINDSSFPPPEALGEVRPVTVAIDPEYSGYVYHHFLLTCWALTSTAMIRRDAFAEVGGFDVSLPFAEDWDLWLRIARGHRFAKIDFVSTLYRQHRTQGYRKLRELDYCSRLLEDAVARWGYASADGRSVEPRLFRQRLARRHLEFGKHHLSAGHLTAALPSLWKAWRNDPARLKYLAILGAAVAGWRPATEP